MLKSNAGQRLASALLALAIGSMVVFAAAAPVGADAQDRDALTACKQTTHHMLA